MIRIVVINYYINFKKDYFKKLNKIKSSITC